jgi:hypothetical protein
MLEPGTVTSTFDAPWKLGVELFLEPALAFCFPAVHMTRLPDDWELQFRESLVRFEATEKPMTIETLLSPIELLAREEGRQEGRQEGLDQARRLDVLDALEARFGSCPDPVDERVGSLSGEPALRRAHRLAVTARTLQDFLGSL